MTRADLEAAIADVHQRSVAAYLERQRIEQARQQIQFQAQQCDLRLVTLDGELEALTKLLAVPPESARAE